MCPGEYIPVILLFVTVESLSAKGDCAQQICVLHSAKKKQEPGFCLALAICERCALCFGKHVKLWGTVQTIFYNNINIAIDVFAVYKHHPPASFPVKAVGLQIWIKDAHGALACFHKDDIVPACGEKANVPFAVSTRVRNDHPAVVV